MACGYWNAGVSDYEAAFHVTFRENPFGGEFTAACGLATVIDLCFVKLKATHEVNRRRQPACDSEFTTERILTKSNVESRFMITHAGFPIAARHCDLIKIGRESGEILLWRSHLSNLQSKHPMRVRERLGSARVSRSGERVLAIADFRCKLEASSASET